MTVFIQVSLKVVNHITIICSKDFEFIRFYSTSSNENITMIWWAAVTCINLAKSNCILILIIALHKLDTSLFHEVDIVDSTSLCSNETFITSIIHSDADNCRFNIHLDNIILIIRINLSSIDFIMNQYTLLISCNDMLSFNRDASYLTLAHSKSLININPFIVICTIG